MKAQHSHPRVRSGSIAKRRTPPIAREAARPSLARRRRRAEQEQGTSVLWLLMMIGGVVAAGFIFALRSQHTVHQLDQAEAQLRNDLERIATYQRHLALEQQRALSVRESEQMAKQSGLIQPKLPASHGAPRPATAATIAAKPATPHATSTAARLLAKPVAAHVKPASAKTTAKPAAAKTTVKPALAKSAVKPSSPTPSAKLKKESHSGRPQPRLAQRR